ncbi:MAG: PqqD family protein [Streptococcaceae bacterium]|jgi:Ni,Fe-hydrogenase maturation factor|nr:PqqD family protein [Streptococcaceae bacterium]
MPKHNATDLSVIYDIRPATKYDEFDGHIRVIKEQNHWSQRFMRRLGVKIPLRSYKELDDYGTFVFKMIDGKRTIHEIGSALSEKYEEAGDQLYERLIPYLEHLERNEKWIQKK